MSAEINRDPYNNHVCIPGLAPMEPDTNEETLINDGQGPWEEYRLDENDTSEVREWPVYQPTIDEEQAIKGRVEGVPGTNDYRSRVERPKKKPAAERVNDSNRYTVRRMAFRFLEGYQKVEGREYKQIGMGNKIKIAQDIAYRMINHRYRRFIGSVKSRAANV